MWTLWCRILRPILIFLSTSRLFYGILYPILITVNKMIIVNKYLALYIPVKSSLSDHLALSRHPFFFFFFFFFF